MKRAGISSQLRGRVIWAVDAFEGRSRTHFNTLKVLQGLVKQAHLRVEPVYVLSPAELNISVEFTPPWVQYYRPAAEASLRALVQSSGIPNLEKESVLTQNAVSTRRTVDTLVAYAKRCGARLIVVSTHARHGVARLFLGSFAETLILRSKIPVLIVGPQLLSHGKFKKVLFPTDFGKDSRKVFDEVLRFSRQFKASLTVFHSIPNPVEPVVQSGIYLLGGAWVPVHRYFAEDIAERKRKIKQLTQVAEKFRVRAQSIVDESGGNIASAILNHARRKKIDLIAMAAQSGPVTSALIGSITRQVVRHAQCPVWILRF